ncbi:MAG: TolC family protein [Bdellovibrionales bacterium]
MTRKIMIDHFIAMLSIGILINFEANAQSISLADAQKIALENSPRILEMAADVEISRAKVQKALAPQLPQVFLSGRHLLDEKFQVMEINLGPQPTEFPLQQPYSLITLGASLTIFDGFGTVNSYRAARFERSAKELEFDFARFEIEHKVRIQFFKALGAQALVVVSKQNVEALEAHLEDVKHLIRGGVATRLDLLKVEVQWEDAKNELLAAEDDAALSIAELSKLVGLNSLSGDLRGELPTLDPDLAKKIETPFPERLDRQALVSRESSALLKASAAKALWFPKIQVFGQQEWYNFSNPDLGADSKFRDAYSVGVGLSWSLFDGGASMADRRVAAEEITKSQQNLRALDQSIPLDVNFWRRKFVHVIAVYKSALNGIKKSEEALRLAKAAVRAGTRTTTDVLDAEHDLNIARAKVVHAQVDAVESVSKLEIAVGKDLNLIKF